ncbi:MAG: DUF6807 family protein [Candidatus Latescibacterota bacterium]|nr:DUF6807 family protein [Candidatus Latescibacterota bacterium]
MTSSTPAVSIVPTAEGFLVSEDGQDVLFYQRETKRFDENYSRSHYIHPLFGLDGELLTEEFPADHPHHCGVYWAWHQVWMREKRIGDAWSLRDFAWDVQDVKVIASDSHAALEADVFWTSPLWTNDQGVRKPFVRETAVIRVHRASRDMRKIDFDIRLVALEDGLRIGGSENAKGYGGFCTRVPLPDDLQFVSSAGDVEPMTEPVEAGPWMDFSGTFGEVGHVSGLAMLCHPSVPGFPQPWILRRKTSMQNPVYPGPHPVALLREDPLVLRYRLVLHRGAGRELDLDHLQAEYAAEGLQERLNG